MEKSVGLRVGFLALLLSACSSGGVPDTTAARTTTTVTAATTTTTAIPQPVVPDSVDYVIGEHDRPTNASGTYQVLFDPPFVMTLPDAWSAEVLNDHYAYFTWAGTGFGLDDQPLVAVQIFDTLVDPDDFGESLETPPDLNGFIQSHPGLVAQDPERAIVAGVAGRSIDFQVVQEDEAGKQVRVEFGRSGDDIAVGFDAQWEVRFITLGVDDETVVITVEVPCCDRLRGFMVEADELIDSIIFASVAPAPGSAVDHGGTWTWLTGDVSSPGRGLIFSVVEGGDGLVAAGVADDGLIWTSADGQSWRPVLGVSDAGDEFVQTLVPTANGLLALGTRVTEVGKGSIEVEGRIWASTDGVNWSVVSSSYGADVLVEYLDDGVGGPIALGVSVNGSTTAFAVSDDGAWHPLVIDKRFSSTHPAALVATPAGTLVVAQGYDDSYLWLTADGETWELVGQLKGAMVADAVVVGDTIVMVGAAQNPADRSLDPTVPRVWLSNDARDWEEIDPGPSGRAYLLDIALSGDGTLLATGRDIDRAVPALWVSAEGRTWELHEVGAGLEQECGCTEILSVAPIGEGAVLVGYDTSNGYEQTAVMTWSDDG